MGVCENLDYFALYFLCLSLCFPEMEVILLERVPLAWYHRRVLKEVSFNRGLKTKERVSLEA